jgi:hypothetical protein
MFIYEESNLNPFMLSILVITLNASVIYLVIK